MGEEWEKLRQMLPMSFGNTASGTSSSKTKNNKKDALSKAFQATERKDHVKSYNGSSSNKIKKSIVNLSRPHGDSEEVLDDDDFGPPKPPTDALTKTSSNLRDEQDHRQKSSSIVLQDDLEEDDFGPPLPEHFDLDRVDDDQEENSDERDVEEEDEIVLPTSHEIQLREHTKAITALTLDPSGSRLITGSRDCQVKFWDFSGMDTSFKPFKSIQPYDGNPVNDIQYSPSGDQILVASASMHTKLYNRNGDLIHEFSKGDQYIRDMKNTRGHVGSVTCCGWDPLDKSRFLTASIDGTVRIWDVNQTNTQKQVIAIKSRLPGGRTSITCASYSLDGKFILASGQDGALWFWDSRGPFFKPSQTIDQAHMQGSGASGMSFSVNSRNFITRGLDDTVKLWDVRKFTSPVCFATDLPNMFEQTNAVFSPDEKFVITGISMRKEQGAGHLLILDKETLKVAYDVPVGQGSVIKTLWHSRINQIMCGTSIGDTFVLYDPNVSVRGAKMCVGRTPKVRDIGAHAAESIIYNPHALPMYKDAEHTGKEKRKREKLRQDPVASRRPDMPAPGPGKQGKLGPNLTQHMMRSILRDTTRDEDPREAILRHAKAAEDDPYWVAPAYKSNQPKPVFADKVYEDDDEERQASLKKRRQ